MNKLVIKILSRERNNIIEEKHKINTLKTELPHPPPHAHTLFSFSFLHKKSFQAFTMADVIVTLGIIAVVAIMTIQPLVQKHHEKQTATILKKAYSTLSNAYTLAVQENGTPDTWGLAQSSRDPKLISFFIPYLNIAKNCIGISSCLPFIQAKELNNGTSSVYTDYYNANNSLVLTDGAILVGVWVHSSNCSSSRGSGTFLSNTCGSMSIDINGTKPPNKMGEDIFPFWLTKNGIVPFGGSMATSYSFSSHCKDKDSTTQENGVGCTSWVITNENLDYLHCNDLDWNTKTKCD